jgi:hypothetical protein
MTWGLLYWILMLIWVIVAWPWPWTVGLPAWPGQIILFILFLALGWKVFGPPIHG